MGLAPGVSQHGAGIGSTVLDFWWVGQSLSFWNPEEGQKLGTCMENMLDLSTAAGQCEMG